MNNALVRLKTFLRLRAQRPRWKLFWIAALGGAGLLLASGTTYAAPNCTISSTAVAFGSYDPLNAAATAGTGTLGFVCSGGVGAGVTYSIALSTGSSGSYATRTMTNGANILNYNLYSTATYTSIWGNGNVGTVVVSASLTRAQARAGVTITVYGTIPAQQNVVPGSYSDSITATVTF